MTCRRQTAGFACVQHCFCAVAALQISFCVEKVFVYPWLVIVTSAELSSVRPHKAHLVVPGRATRAAILHHLLWLCYTKPFACCWLALCTAFGSHDFQRLPGLAESW